MSLGSIEVLLILGIICLLLEFLKIPGIGFLFLGLGSISTAVLLYYFPNIVNYQFAIVGLVSFLWFLVLWKPMKNFIYNKKSKNDYFDIIGNRVKVVEHDIKPGDYGLVEWSGSIMNAKLIPEEEDKEAKIGDILYVHKVKGNRLICSYKKPKT